MCTFLSEGESGMYSQSLHVPYCPPVDQLDSAAGAQVTQADVSLTNDTKSGWGDATSMAPPSLGKTLTHIHSGGPGGLPLGHTPSG